MTQGKRTLTVPNKHLEQVPALHEIRSRDHPVSGYRCCLFQPSVGRCKWFHPRECRVYRCLGRHLRRIRRNTPHDDGTHDLEQTREFSRPAIPLFVVLTGNYFQKSYSVYSCAAFPLANLLSDLPFSAVRIFTYNITIYFTSGLHHSAGAFWTFHLISYLRYLATQVSTPPSVCLSYSSPTSSNTPDTSFLSSQGFH